MPTFILGDVHLALLPFLAISILLILIPGPDTAVTTKNVLVGGQRGGILASIGVTIGLLTWTIAAAFGIAALLKASAVAFLVLKIVGALYLTWIGIQMLRSRDRFEVEPHQRAVPGAKALRQGLLSDLGNPKIAVFFTSFLPQFVHSGSDVFLSLLVLGTVFAALTLAWLVAYTVLLVRASGLVRRSRVRKTLDRLTGVVLIGFGIRLAFEHR